MMFQCDVTFHDKPDFNSGDRQDGGQSDSTSEGSLQSCYVSLSNYQLAFFSDKSSDKPFYQRNVAGLLSNLDSNSITLNEKHSNDPLFTIYASASILEKVQKICQEYSNEKVAWNLLMDTPYYRPQESYLTNLNRNSNFKGIVTLLVIMTVFAKGRDIINSHLTYGLRPMEDLGSNKLLLVECAAVCFTLTSILMILFEKLAFKKVISNKTTTILEGFNLLVVYAFPIYFCCKYEPHVILALCYALLTLIVVLKMISYMHFMHELRNALPSILSSKQGKVEVSAENLAIIQKHEKDPSGIVNVKDILYFYFAPVLVYQLWYPRTEKVDKPRAFRLAVQIIIFQVVQAYWVNQHLIPIVKTTTDVFQNGTIPQMIEKFFEASNTYLPTILLNAYGFFHLLPNFFAEILRFSNREIYSDWWNNTSIRTFWNRWNIPVHKWCVRHIYYPLQKHGYSKTVATCAVFLFSGIMHEYFYSVPVRFVACNAVLGLFLQAPMMMAEKKYSQVMEKYNLGNIFMWVGTWCFALTSGIVTYRMKYLELNRGQE